MNQYLGVPKSTIRCGNYRLDLERFVSRGTPILLLMGEVAGCEKQWLAHMRTHFGGAWGRTRGAQMDRWADS